MTRKDTILIAVVINAGLLAILFTTAVIYDTDKISEPLELAVSQPDQKISPSETPGSMVAALSSGDEVDNVLKYYNTSSQSIQVAPSESYPVETLALQQESAQEEGWASTPQGQDPLIEIKVKKGDVLEKIARANKTTIGAIKKYNQLENEKLAIGQVIKIPVKKNSNAEAPVAEIKSSPEIDPAQNQPVYHVIRSGDSPWKLAKEYHVNYEDITRLNNLTEEKARNLKIGDRIRVK